MVRLSLCAHQFTVNHLSDATLRRMGDYLLPPGPGRRVEVNPEDVRRFASVRGDAESVALQKAVSEALLEEGFIPFHASAIEYGGKAYMFTAPSGTGKSTHSRLWRERLGSQVQYINDDKPFLHFSPEGILVWGSPWSGKEELQSNRCAPLGGIVVLRQAPVNRLSPLSPEDAFPLLLRQTHLYPDTSRRLEVVRLIHRLCQERLFLLECTPSQEAVTLSFNALTI